MDYSDGQWDQHREYDEQEHPDKGQISGHCFTLNGLRLDFCGGPYAAMAGMPVTRYMRSLRGPVVLQVSPRSAQCASPQRVVLVPPTEAKPASSLRSGVESSEPRWRPAGES